MPDRLDDDELAAVLTAIDELGEKLTDPPPRFRDSAAHVSGLLASAEQKLRALHGLPTGPSA